jgi:hypothetical protein
MERRKGLLSSAEQFLGKRENNREDAAVLQGCSTSTASRLRRASRRPREAGMVRRLRERDARVEGPADDRLAVRLVVPEIRHRRRLEDAQPGDIVNFKGHVGFFAGFGPNGTVRILGGNQGRRARAPSASRISSAAASSRCAAPGNIGEGYDRPGQRSAVRDADGRAQDSFNKKLEVEAATRALVIKYMRDQLGLSAEALYASQKQEEIEKAILAAKQDATDKHITFSPDQEAALRKQIGDQYDAEHAMALVNDRIKEQTDLRSR